MTVAPLWGTSFSGGSKSGWISRRTCSCGFRQRRNNMRRGGAANAPSCAPCSDRLAQFPQSHDHGHLRKSAANDFAEVASVHHGRGRRGGNAHHVRFAPRDKINHVTGRGRKHDQNALAQVKDRNDHGGRSQKSRRFDELIQGRCGCRGLSPLSRVSRTDRTASQCRRPSRRT